MHNTIVKQEMIEEQKSIIEKLKFEFNKIESQRVEHLNQLKLYQKNVRIYENMKKDIEKEIQKMELNLLTTNMFTDFDNLENFDLLSLEEQNVIAKGIDKTDYTNYGHPLLFDLKKTVLEIIELKKAYPNWTLINLQKTGQYDIMPPLNFYKFIFKTPLNHWFTYGGIHVS